MKNVSLVKVSAMVFSVALASSFVNADDKVSKTMENAQANAAEVEKQQTFPALLESLDTNNDAMLSEAEVSVEHSQFLQEEFAKIDTNQDKNIDEEEFNAYFVAVNDKAFNVAKRKI